jgi:23S rRNA-/tRNA-specific pseudouridylate synthase
VDQGGWLLLVDGKAGKTRDAVREGQKLALEVVLEIPAEDALAQPVALEVVHEDESILVINKPAGLVVHPGAGNADNTVMNGLLYRWPELGPCAEGPALCTVSIKIQRGFLWWPKTWRPTTRWFPNCRSVR